MVDDAIELTLGVRVTGLSAIAELVVDPNLDWFCAWADDGVALLLCNGLDAVFLPFFFPA